MYQQFSSRDEYLQEQRSRHGTNSRRQRPRRRYTEVELSAGHVNPLLAAAEAKRASASVPVTATWLCEVGEVVTVDVDHLRQAVVVDRADVFGQRVYRLAFAGGKRETFNAAQMAAILVRPVVQAAAQVVGDYEAVTAMKRGSGRGLWHLPAAAHLALVK
jgi:hypothetical protein